MGGWLLAWGLVAPWANGVLRILFHFTHLLGKVDGASGVLVQELLQHDGIVAPVARFGRVGDELLELSALSEAVDGLLRDIGPKVNRQSHLQVGLRQQVTELLTALKLVVLQPLRQEVGPSLLKHGAGELDRLNGIQLSLLEEGGEVLEDGLGLARLSRNLLEPLDCLGVPQYVPRGLGSELGSSANVLSCHQTVKLSQVKLLGAGKIHSPGQRDRQLVVPQCVHYVRDEALLVHSDLEDLSLANGDAEDTAGGRLGGGRKNRVGGDPRPVKGLCCVDVEHEKVAHFCDHEYNVVLRRSLHGDWEIVGSLGGHGDCLRRASVG